MPKHCVVQYALQNVSISDNQSQPQSQLYIITRNRSSVCMPCKCITFQLHLKLQSAYIYHDMDIARYKFDKSGR